MVHKILVLADDDCLVRLSALPNDRIIGGMKTQIKDVRSLMTLADNPLRQRGRQLRIDEEVHAECRTAWSA